jgi:hypothetical protein
VTLRGLLAQSVDARAADLVLLGDVVQNSGSSNRSLFSSASSPRQKSANMLMRFALQSVMICTISGLICSS